MGHLLHLEARIFSVESNVVLKRPDLQCVDSITTAELRSTLLSINSNQENSVEVFDELIGWLPDLGAMAG